VLEVVYESRFRMILRMTATQRYGPWCFGGFVALRLALVAWFFAHSEIQEADVLARREYRFFSRRGALQVDVRFERNGQVRTETVRWELAGQPLEHGSKFASQTQG
jgi:membrane protein implicated in regulation of membrane protease activity